MSSILSFSDVCVNFALPDQRASVCVADNVSLALNRGEIFGIVGESGSGKSTLANSVMGLLPRNATVSGTIKVNGRNVVGLGDDDLRHLRGNEVAMIFQDASASLDPTWSVGDQIAETLRAHQAITRRAAKQQAIHLMTEVGIADAALRYHEVPHRFSGGMRQRIVIAAALANRPQLLIADEPTTALDVTIQAQVLQLINRLRIANDMTVLLITHDLGVVSQICDRVAVMYGGKLIEMAATIDLFAKPSHPYTRALLAANPALAKPGARLPVIPVEWSAASLKEAEQLKASSALLEARHG